MGGGVSLFLRDAVLDETERQLRDSGYTVVGLDAGDWHDEAVLHDAVAAALSFPGYYGRNLDALNDCLGEVAHGDYGWEPTDATGLVVVLRHFAEFARQQPALARHVAAAFAGTTAEAILFGHRLLWLLQVDDPEFRLAVERSGFVPWSDHEWLDAKRR
jgi:hypothetical protein